MRDRKGVKTTTRELEDMEYDVSLLGGYADEEEISQDITEMLLVVMQVLNFLRMYKDPPSSLQISVKIRYQGTKPNGRLRRSTGIAIHCEYQPNQISEPWKQGPI